MDIYLGHESKPTAAYLRELQAGTGGASATADPFAKIYDMIDDGNRATEDLLSKIAAIKAALGDATAGFLSRVERIERLEASGNRIERLESSGNPFSDQRGRPEHMSPVKWAERNAK